MHTDKCGGQQAKHDRDRAAHLAEDRIRCGDECAKIIEAAAEQRINNLQLEVHAANRERDMADQAASNTSKAAEQMRKQCESSARAVRDQCESNANAMQIQCKPNRIKFEANVNQKRIHCESSANTMQISCKCIANPLRIKCKYNAMNEGPLRKSIFAHGTKSWAKKRGPCEFHPQTLYSCNWFK